MFFIAENELDKEVFAEAAAENGNQGIVFHQQLAEKYRQRAIKAEKKLADLEVVLMYANDVVNGWHTLTFRKVGVEMTPKVISLGQALEAANVKTR